MGSSRDRVCFRERGIQSEIDPDPGRASQMYPTGKDPLDTAASEGRRVAWSRRGRRKHQGDKRSPSKGRFRGRWCWECLTNRLYFLLSTFCTNVPYLTPETMINACFLKTATSPRQPIPRCCQEPQAGAVTVMSPSTVALISAKYSGADPAGPT